MIFSYLLNMQSHPSWVCGLKQEKQRIAREINESHPSWVCGLKQVHHGGIITPGGSHPSWVCGLKRIYAKRKFNASCVTPFVGVWIETKLLQMLGYGNFVTPFVGVWIETITSSSTAHQL